MSSPSTTASSIPTTPTTPCSLPSPVEAATNPMQSSMPYLALPPPVAVRPRRILQPSFKLQAPPPSLKCRVTIIEEQEDEEGFEIHVPTITAAKPAADAGSSRPKPLASSNAPSAILSPSATRPNTSFADAVAGRNLVSPAPIASSVTMAFGEKLSSEKLSGQPRSTKAGARTHRRAQSISMSVSDVGLVRRTPRSGPEEPRRPTSLTPSPRIVHFAPIPEAGLARAAHPRVSALAPAHPGLRPSYGLAPPPRSHSREDSIPRALATGRVIALPSFEDDAFAIRGSSSYAFGSNPAAIAVGRDFEQWGH